MGDLGISWYIHINHTFDNLFFGKFQAEPQDPGSLVTFLDQNCFKDGWRELKQLWGTATTVWLTYQTL